MYDPYDSIKGGGRRNIRQRLIGPGDKTKSAMCRKDYNHLLKPSLLLELALFSSKAVSELISEGVEEETTVERALPDPTFLGLYIFTAFEF